MKILFVSSGNSMDGSYHPTSFVKSQGESVRRKGHNLEFFLIKGRGLKSYFKHIFILRKFLKKRSFDIIHAHYGLCGWVARLAFPGVPIVISFMGDDLYGDADHKGRKKPIDFVFIFFNKRLQRWVDFIIVKSKNLADHVAGHARRRNKMAILPNGVDFERFRPMEKEKAAEALSIEPRDKKNVLFLGDKANPRKNFRLLDEALKLISSEKNNKNRAGIELLAPFPVPGDQIPYYMNLADVFVMTSFKEGSPNVVKEAMACNCPVVSTDAGDAADVISGTEGCYVTTFEPKDLANKISLALAFAKRTKGRENIKHLELSVIADRLIGIYEGLNSY